MPVRSEDLHKSPTWLRPLWQFSRSDFFIVAFIYLLSQPKIVQMNLVFQQACLINNRCSVNSLISKYHANHSFHSPKTSSSVDLVSPCSILTSRTLPESLHYTLELSTPIIASVGYTVQLKVILKNI